MAKKAFILGGDGDIGKEICRLFKTKGYKMIAPNLLELDLEDITSVDKYFKNKKINPDVIIHCAGWNEPQPFEQITLPKVSKANMINYLGFIRVLHYLVPSMKRRRNGNIVGISSLYGIFSRKGRLLYATSKHALNGLLKTLAIEFGEYNIKVNIVSPGFVDTKLTRNNNSSAIIKSFIRRIPLKRLAKPKDIASVIWFLCSKENSYINGANIVVDGGYSIGGFQE